MIFLPENRWNRSRSILLEADDLTVTFRDDNGELDALEGVSFAVRPQEFVCLLGLIRQREDDPAATRSPACSR